MKVVVTGFGPFCDAKVNSSTLVAQAVKTLWENCQRAPEPFSKLIIFPNLEVSYSAVDRLIPALWKSLKPDLLIHIGLYSGATKIYLEKRARSGPYDLPDVLGQISAVEYFDHSIFTTLNLAEPCDLLNSAGYSISLSDDPGCYLCGYIYLKSLQVDPNSALFIHVPDVSDKYPVEYLAECIFLVIIHLAKQRNLDVPPEFYEFFESKVNRPPCQSKLPG